LVQNTRFMNPSAWRHCLAALAFGVAVCGAAQEQDPGFVLQGEGGLVTALVLDPSSPATVYAATARGLYKSENGGTTWRQTGRGIGSHSLLALAIDPQSPSHLYATTDAGGVFRSADGGEHWAPSNQGLTARYVGSIAVDPDHPGIVYAGAEAGLIFRSEDAGSTWKGLASPTTRVSITAIAIDPSPPGAVYVGTNSEGIFRSADRGATWTHATGQLAKGTVWGMAFRGTPTTLYAATHDGLYRSTNGGTTWAACNRGLRSWNVLAVESDPAAASTMYAATAAAIYKSVDAGQSWTELQKDPHGRPEDRGRRRKMGRAASRRGEPDRCGGRQGARRRGRAGGDRPSRASAGTIHPGGHPAPPRPARRPLERRRLQTAALVRRHPRATALTAVRRP
jgi:photosystem II stability/assembly factor-like uncharacterized protein